MSDIKDGGPAFPHDITKRSDVYGMTLRDYFAAKAMAAIITKYGAYTDDESAPDSPRGMREDVPTVVDVAEYAYIQADAMIAERNG